MPLYEYQCESCGQKKERLQKRGDPPPFCKQCSEDMKKRISAGSFALKGDGWAKDNYGLKQKN
jgi:putative FmdB family regulatory protein